MQISTYLYSIAILVALVYLMPHIRRQSPFEVLALAWLYIADTIINSFDTVVFGLQWYFTSAASDETEYIPDMVKQGLEDLKKEQEKHGGVVPRETASSMCLIVALTLVRIYFGIIVMAFARQVLQKQMQIIVLEAPSDIDEQDGPFSNGLREGEGRKGRLGRMMVSYGRNYWLGQQESERMDEGFSKQGP